MQNISIIGSTEPNLKAVSQQIKRLMKQGKLKEALEICNQELCQNYLPILSQKISILMKQGKLKEALEICNYNQYKDNLVIQNKKLRILHHLKPDDFDVQMDYLKNKKIIKNLVEWKIELFKDLPNLNDISFQSTQLLTRIYCDDISLEELELLSIDAWEHLILLIAYHEKHNSSSALRLVKEHISQYKNDNEKRKIMNRLKERLSSKKIKIFDVNFYCTILHSHIDFDLAETIMNSKKESNQNSDNHKNVSVVNVPVQQFTADSKIKASSTKVASNIIEVSGIKNNRYSTTKNTTPVSHVEGNLQTSDVLLKDIFSEDILEIGCFLYCEMQKEETRSNAIHAWDILESMSMKSAYDVNAMKCMINLLKRLKGDTSMISPVAISLDDKKAEILQKKYKKK